jgi:hypothetical protein
VLASGRIHHPKRAARLGTPVRSRFCNDSRAVITSRIETLTCASALPQLKFSSHRRTPGTIHEITGIVTETGHRVFSWNFVWFSGSSFFQLHKKYLRRGFSASCPPRTLSFT